MKADDPLVGPTYRFYLVRDLAKPGRPFPEMRDNLFEAFDWATSTRGTLDAALTYGRVHTSGRFEVAKLNVSPTQTQLVPVAVCGAAEADEPH